MVLIFDLDDTLYDETRFVMSGLRAVAQHGQAAFGWPEDASFAELVALLNRHGRGRVFDEWLQGHGRFSRAQVAACVRVYRHHAPEIGLYPGVRSLLARWGARSPLYLVTDGHKIVQQNKVAALELQPMFRRVFITHRFGIRHAKPSLHCFEIIRRTERCAWSDMVYVGDNPAKDFVNLNAQGALTVRVLTGSHRDVVARPGHDARHVVANVSALPSALDLG